MKRMDEIKTARRYDVPLRRSEVTKIVYGGTAVKISDFTEEIKNASPPAPQFNIYFGELHGHSNLSDARPDPDTYFKTARDIAKVDFCALTDHDHGGVGKPELWDEKWDIIQQKTAEYNAEGKFVTILGYERDSYPWYNNLVVYYKNAQSEMLRGRIDGEIDRSELDAFLKREDILLVPHTTSFIDSGTDFESIPLVLMTPLIEVYSKWGTSEYMGNKNPVRIQTDGGFWRDALEKGAKMGCIAASDDHMGYPGMPSPAEKTFDNLHYTQPGLTAVLVESLTRENIFDALKSRRCYALDGARISVDFRINGSYMGSEITADNRDIYLNVTGESALNTITLIKNGRDYIIYTVCGDKIAYSDSLIDYKAERDTDYYYLRIEQQDGHRAWTSPIWVKSV